MILKFTKKIVDEGTQEGLNPLYIRSSIKEYLQILVLYFIYTNKHYKGRYIFTGGTCLRHFFGLERLSEDLDFDTVGKVNTKDLAHGLNDFFTKELQFGDISISVKQQGKQVLLKFPVLMQLGPADPGESDYLYIKCDIEPAIGSSYKTILSSKTAHGYSFVALHYDLRSLFAGKIVAILTRNLLTGKQDRQTIKGRDFYDLLWFLKHGTPVNLELVRERLGETTLSLSDLQARITAKVNRATTKFTTDFKNDLLPFIASTSFLDDYVDNYESEFRRYNLTADASEQQ
ncbi:MAG: nucleotidyl transferase AbiEii/AbiGii toxin family protein [Candidatus Dojkabacteria bacterium]